MGKTTGFLEYVRRDDPARAPEERVHDWNEFHLALPDAVREQQGGRCMNCGVPFCQTGMVYEGKTFGCPLHNLIPEWNDMIFAGNRSHALSRLLKTNNFPEFTGRVGPASMPASAASTAAPSPSGTTSCASLRTPLPTTRSSATARPSGLGKRWPW